MTHDELFAEYRRLDSELSNMEGVHLKCVDLGYTPPTLGSSPEYAELTRRAAEVWKQMEEGS